MKLAISGLFLIVVGVQGLGICPGGGPSLNLRCDARRPWPACPPDSWCYATGSVDAGEVYFCCPSDPGPAYRVPVVQQRVVFPTFLPQQPAFGVRPFAAKTVKRQPTRQSHPEGPHHELEEETPLANNNLPFAPIVFIHPATPPPGFQGPVKTLQPGERQDFNVGQGEGQAPPSMATMEDGNNYEIIFPGQPLAPERALPPQFPDVSEVRPSEAGRHQLGGPPVNVRPTFAPPTNVRLPFRQSQGPPQGFPQGIPQGLPQELPQGVPQGLPQGFPQGLPQQPLGTPFPQFPQPHLRGSPQQPSFPQQPTFPQQNLGGFPQRPLGALPHQGIGGFPQQPQFPGSNFGGMPMNNFGGFPQNNFGGIPRNNFGGLPRVNFGGVPTTQMPQFPGPTRTLGRVFPEHTGNPSPATNWGAFGTRSPYPQQPLGLPNNPFMYIPQAARANAYPRGTNPNLVNTQYPFGSTQRKAPIDNDDNDNIVWYNPGNAMPSVTFPEAAPQMPNIVRRTEANN